MNREYHRWHSHNLNRDMEFLWFGHHGRPLLMFPTSGGRFFENEDFHLVGSLADKVDRGDLQIVCVDSIDRESWMCNWAHPSGRVRRHDQYDQYLRHELIPYIEWRTGRNDLIVYGASLGAYHAANLAARYPDHVGRAVLFSGVFGIERFLDGFWNELAYFHSPPAYIPNMEGEWAARLGWVEWVVATGEHDHVVAENRRFAELLRSKGAPVHSEFWAGQFGHDWPWWREHLRRFV